MSVNQFIKLVRLPGRSANERLVFSVVLAGQRGDSGCNAGNPYIESWTGLGDKTITRTIARLEDDGLLRREGGRNSRRLFITDAGWALLREGSGTEGEEAVAPAPPPTPTEPAAEKPKKKKAAQKNPTIEEHAGRELPDCIPPALWREFVTMRHTEKGPFSEGAATGVINKVVRLKGEGYDPVKLLRGAIEGCWLSVHEQDNFKVASAARGDQRRRPQGRFL